MRLALALVALVCLASCGRSDDKRAAATTPPDAGTSAPMRIVSVGSAVTETVFALGAGDLVVGVDTSSLFPEAATKRPQVGYQRTLAAEGLLTLKPSLVLAAGEAGPPAVLEQLRGAGVRIEVMPLDPTVEGAKARITKIAALLGLSPGVALAELETDLGQARELVGKATTRPRVLVFYARGTNTVHVFGKKTSADAMLALAGADNAIAELEGSKALTAEAIISAKPDILLLPTRGLESLGGVEGLLKVPGVAETPAGKARRVLTMDDLLLLGFGPRTGKAALELASKLHPELRAPAQKKDEP
jgi:iron complex transport system substrate-binding protein